MNNVIESSPEPLDVEISVVKCPVHSFHFISMPREAGGDDLGYTAKCPIRGCLAGVRKIRQ